MPRVLGTRKATGRRSGLFGQKPAPASRTTASPAEFDELLLAGARLCPKRPDASLSLSLFPSRPLGIQGTRRTIRKPNKETVMKKCHPYHSDSWPRDRAGRWPRRARPRPPAAPTKGAFQRDLLGVYSGTRREGTRPGSGGAAEQVRLASGARGEVDRRGGTCTSPSATTADQEWRPAKSRRPSGLGNESAQVDTKTTDKAEIKKILEKSFAHVHQVIGTLPDADLDKMVEFLWARVTVRRC